MIGKLLFLITLPLAMYGCGSKSSSESDPYAGSWKTECMSPENGVFSSIFFGDIQGSSIIWVKETVRISKSKISFNTDYYSDANCETISDSPLLRQMIELTGIESVIGKIKTRKEKVSDQGYPFVSYIAHVDLFDSAGEFSFYRVDDRLYYVEYDFRASDEATDAEKYHVNFNRYYIKQ